MQRSGALVGAGNGNFNSHTSALVVGNKVLVINLKADAVKAPTYGLDYEIVHRPGSVHQVPESLSRLPHPPSVRK